jgi:prolyl oligopeptidase
MHTNKKLPVHRFKIVPLVALAILLTMQNKAQLQYPTTKQTSQTDNYFGTNVADPYRWLEDDKSAETKDWVIAQNKVTFGYLDKIPYRTNFKAALEKVFNYPKYSAPFRNNQYYYFYKNSGLQNQSVLYRQKGLNGTPEVLLDPNTLSPDGTTRLTVFNVSKNGKYAVVGLSEGGSDWQTYKVMELATKKMLADKLDWVKISGAAWAGNGFYYSRYPAPEKGASALSNKNENHQVWYHNVGTAQSADILVYEDASNPQRFHTASVSEDEKYLYIYLSDRGKGLDGNAIKVKNLQQPNSNLYDVVSEITNTSYSIIDNTATEFLLTTNDGAPNEKIISTSITTPNVKNAKVIIAEKAEPLKSVSTCNNQIFVTYLKDVTTRVYVYNFNGKQIREVKLPSLGTTGGLSGNKDDKELFYVFSNFTTPPTIYKYNVATGISTTFRKPEVVFDPQKYTTKQVFYTSKDGTKIPMFIVYKNGMQLNSNNVTLLYGYGGFNISLEPNFSATLIPFLDAGGIYASANLRGGSEYGEAWHQQGMKLKKQNVFDDFIAAGDYLIKEKYTRSAKLALRGGSNGGLLVGAVINQRPELARVAIPQVGVMDMLRFHKFTIGWNWVADYGSSELDEANFKNLYAYSPLHNISNTANYPSVMVTTADHDDRVVPAHSFKYTAELQNKYTGKNPMLIRIDTNSGHGASNTQKNIESIADIYSFIFNETGTVPSF